MLRKSTPLLLLITIFTFLVQDGYSQCSYNNVFWTDLTPAGQGLTDGEYDAYGGDLYTVNVIAGETYVFSTCNSEIFGFDSQLTLYDNTGTMVLGYDDDYCAPFSQITWTATYTGVVNLLLDEYNCQNTGGGDFLGLMAVEVTWLAPPACTALPLEPICTSVGLDFPAGVTGTDATITDPGNDWDCILDAPDATFYYLEIATAGNINMTLNGSAADVDFIIWGPYTDLTAAEDNCGLWGNGGSTGNVIDCSFSTSATEYPDITAATVGQVYVMMVSNYAGVPQDITLQQTGGTGATDCSIVCGAEAGTVTTQINGGAAASPLILCQNDCATVNSNDDYTLPTPAPGEGSELLYAIYDCPPTTGNPSTDPCWTGYYWTGEDFTDCNNGTSQLLGLAMGRVFYLAPITADDGDNVNPATLGHDNDGDGCFDQGTAIQIVYLNPISASGSMNSCTGVATITVTGGMPQFNGSNYTITNTGSGTLAGTPITHNGSVTISGLTNGQTVSLTITDSQGCSYLFSYGPLTVETPANAGTNGAITVCSSDSPVNLFASLGGTPQITGSWNGGLTGGHLGTYDPGTFSSGTFTYTVNGTGGCPNATATVTVTENPAVNAGTDGSTSICDNSVAVIDLFSLISGEQAGGTWSRTTGTGGTFNAGAGTFTPASGATSSTFTYSLTGTAPCPNDQSVATVNITAAPNAGTNGSITLCSTDASVNLFSSLGGTPDATGTWSGPSVLTGGNLGTYDPSTMTPGIYTYTVTGIAPCTNATATVTVTENTAPNAGTNGSISVCSNQAAVDLFNSLGGTPDATGTWSGPSALGGGNLGTYNPSSMTPGIYTYTVTGLAPCNNATATVTVTENPGPDAGLDGNTTICDNSIAVIDLFSLISGEQAGGTWIRSTGTGGTFNAGAGTYTPASGATTSTFTYTITGIAPCVDDQSVATVTINPEVNAGVDGNTTVCETSVAVIDLFSLISGEQAGGTWTQTSGSGGTFNAGAGTYTPAIGATSSTFTYTLTGIAPCPNDQSVASVNIIAVPQAGTDGATTVCESSVAAIDLFSLITGEQAGGTWTQTSGSGGTFNAGAGTYTPAVGATTSTFTYTLTGTAPCIDDQSVATVNITGTLDAGTDGSTSLCETNVSAIDLFSLITGEQLGGTWTRTTGTGGTFNAGAGTFTPAIGATTSTFTYTLTGTPPCIDDQSVATVNIMAAPNAGTDGNATVCETSIAAIDLFGLITGEQAGGTWIQTSGTGGTFNAGAGTYTPAAGATTSTFTYTVSGIAPCVDDQSVVTVNINAAPNAGTDGSTTVCETSVAAIDLFSLITGEQAGGTWTQTSGTGGTFNAGAGTYTPAVGATTSTFTYTVSGTAPCVDDQSVATININAAPNAGTDGNTAVCETSIASIDLFSLITGEQAGGTWIQTSGTGGTFNAGAGTYTPAVGATTSTFTYSVSGIAPCVVDQSVATVNINAAPNAGTDGNTTVCETSIAAIDLFSLITGEQAGGTWTQTSGTGGTFNAGAGTYTPAVGATTSTFTYTVSGTAPCIDVQSVATVNINAAPNAGTDGNTAVCETSIASIDLFSLITGEQAGGTWIQTSGTGGTFNAGAGTFTPAMGATTSTFTYTVSGIAPCVDDQSIATVNINAAPNAGADGSTTICETSATSIDLFSLISGEQAGGTWTQTSGTGGTFNAGAGTFTPAMGATTSTFEYTVTGVAPCVDDQSVVTININTAPNAGADGNTTVCESSVVSIDLFGLITGEQMGGTWTQTSGTGGTFNAGSGSYTPAVGATTSVFVYTISGTAPCVDDQSTVTVNISAEPNAGADGNTSVCDNSSATIDLYSLISGEQSGGTWTQSSGSGGTFNAAAGTYTPALGATSSTFTYTVTGTAPCVDDLSIVTLSITNSPLAPVVDKDTVYCLTDTPVSMTVTGTGGTYTWYTDAALTNSLGTGSTYLPGVQLGSNTFYVTETNGLCVSQAGLATIQFNDCDTMTDVVVPTAFTPNNDLENDEWEIVNIDETYPNNQVFVYNRWGAVIFESKKGDYTSRMWDGTYNGEKLPVASYYYIIYTTGDASGEILKGVVTIVNGK